MVTEGRSIRAPRLLVYVAPCRLSVDAAVKLGAFAKEQFGEGTTIQGSAEDGWRVTEATK